MAYATPHDPLLKLALYSGLAVFLLTLALLLAIVILRSITDRRERRLHALIDYWQPLFSRVSEGISFKTPRIRNSDRETILTAWVNYTESALIRGETCMALRQLAINLKLDVCARQMLAHGEIGARLFAIVALGRLKSSDAWDSLARLVLDRNPLISLLATRSLLQIDAASAVPAMLNELTRRNDWPIAKVAAVMREVSAAVLAPPLLEALRSVTPLNAPRLLNLLETVDLGDTWPALAPLLHPERPIEVIAAALKICRDPRALDAIRPLAIHQEWTVRAQAAAALGRLGEDEDRLRLQAMLGDPEWWVRYQAGLALTSIPSMQRQKLESLRARLNDPSVTEILTRVLAETAPQTRRPT